MTNRVRACVFAALVCIGMTAASAARAAYGDITLVGFLGFNDATRLTNVWGYTDAGTGTEYALVGDWFGGFYIVDVSDPSNPIKIRKVTGVPGFDLKPFGHYVYSCDGNASGRDTRIVDLAQPFAPHILPTTLASCHTISISTQGNMFTEYPGVHVYDLMRDPEHPDSLAFLPGQGHDSTPRGDRLYDFNGGSLNIWNIQDPANPLLLSTNDDSTIGYYHSGDESKDHNYLYVCDEYAITPSPDIVIFDIHDPTNPVRIGDINDPTSRVHQLYVVGDLMFCGYYTAGFKVFDLTDPANPVLLDSYDTSPYQAETGSDVYNGAYNAYPFASSGVVYVSDHPTGLFLFSVEGFTDGPTGVAATPRPNSIDLGQNFPNPFNPTTTITYGMRTPDRVIVRVYDSHGAIVRTLVDEYQASGSHRVEWDGKDDVGRAVASGIYYYRVSAGAASAARRMVLLK